MVDFNQLLYDKQAKRISELTASNMQLLREVQSLTLGLDRDTLVKRNAALTAELRRLHWPAHYYLKMQEMILESDLLMDEWNRFISFLKLSSDDIPGLTMLETVDDQDV